ncbi:activator-dependent family glycosyltransferase [Micromonospora ureilytica]|uniref:activator-dependent family glycosyltransferase n=1 Tax=Micromonospora ureilytica TaxID=709868 RepID=UPI004039CFAE
MRVLFTTFAARNHAHVQVPLAWALRAAGHDVHVASHPDLAGVITRTGLTAVPVGAPLLEDETMQDLREQQEESEQAAGEEAPDAQVLLRMDELRPDRLTYDHMHGVFTAMAATVFQTYSDAAMVDDLVSYARWWRPDLVVWDPLTFGGAVAARVSGAAHARLLFGLDLVGRMRGSYLRVLADREPALREDPMAEWLGDVLARYGGEFTEDLVVGQWTVDPVPAALRMPTGLLTLDMRCVPYNGQGSVPDWLREPPSRPRVCVTLGVSHRTVMGGDQVSTADLLDAVADVDVEVVATLDAGQLGARRLPGNVRTVDFLPMDALLPTCAAIVSHGGSGTVHTAMEYGVPQITVVGDMWDNALRGRMLQRSGAGLTVDVAELTPPRLRDMLIRVVEERPFRDQATRIRRQMLGCPSPADVVPMLESLTREHRAR